MHTNTQRNLVAKHLTTSRVLLRPPLRGMLPGMVALIERASGSLYTGVAMPVSVKGILVCSSSNIQIFDRKLCVYKIARATVNAAPDMGFDDGAFCIFGDDCTATLSDHDVRGFLDGGRVEGHAIIVSSCKDPRCVEEMGTGGNV